MTAYFIVRAEVRTIDRDAFDRWYETEHLPEAIGAFAALSAWRGWSAEDASVHLAFYEFPDLATARAATTPEKLAPLIAEFDRNFPEVTRSRDFVEVRQAL
jgi:hypothetical protein